MTTSLRDRLASIGSIAVRAVFPSRRHPTPLDPGPESGDEAIARATIEAGRPRIGQAEVVVRTDRPSTATALRAVLTDIVALAEHERAAPAGTDVVALVGPRPEDGADDPGADHPGADHPVADRQHDDDLAPCGLATPGDPLVWCDDREEAIARLMGHVTRAFAIGASGRLVLHGAVAADDERGVLLVAPSGGGKSTCVAALAGGGWATLTDEAVAVSPDGSRFETFGRPLRLRPDSIDLLADAGAWDALAPAVVERGRSGTQLLLSRLPAGLHREVRPAAVVLLERIREPGPDDEPMVPALRRLSGPEAVVRLIDQTLSPPSEAGDAVLTLAALVSRAAPWALTYRTVAEATDLLRGLDLHTDTDARAPGGPTVDEAVARLPADDPSGPSGGIRRSPTVRTIELADGCILHDGRSARVMALDPRGRDLWGLLDGSRTTSELVHHLTATHDAGGIDDQVERDLLDFVDQLRQAGLLA